MVGRYGGAFLSGFRWNHVVSVVVPPLSVELAGAHHDRAGVGAALARGGRRWRRRRNEQRSQVITTTTKTVVVSANSAVNIGRWSNLAIIALSPFSLVEGG